MNRKMWRIIVISALLAATLANAADAPRPALAPETVPSGHHGSPLGGPVRAVLFRAVL